MKKYIRENNKNCKISTYHLITDNSKTDYEISEYKKNVINIVNSIAYIWKMHNWSGNYSNINPRKKTDRRSCGRPFAPEITIRAGGKEGRTGALVPCCQTLGPPNEEKSILGHMDLQSLEDIYNDEPYKKLIKAHATKNFDDIDYCKDCDFLYEDPEVMVWTNDDKAKINHMLGTEEDFILTKYNS
jgi:radical SAM protein with 4Fe4S-binding SPASM domain